MVNIVKQRGNTSSTNTSNKVVTHRQKHGQQTRTSNVSTSSTSTTSTASTSSTTSTTCTMSNLHATVTIQNIIDVGILTLLHLPHGSHFGSNHFGLRYIQSLVTAAIAEVPQWQQKSIAFHTMVVKILKLIDYIRKATSGFATAN
jgi:hypothetical protein